MYLKCFKKKAKPEINSVFKQDSVLLMYIILVRCQGSKQINPN